MIPIVLVRIVSIIGMGRASVASFVIVVWVLGAWVVLSLEPKRDASFVLVIGTSSMAFMTSFLSWSIEVERDAAFLLMWRRAVVPEVHPFCSRRVHKSVYLV